MEKTYEIISFFIRRKWSALSPYSKSSSRVTSGFFGTVRTAHSSSQFESIPDFIVYLSTLSQ